MAGDVADVQAIGVPDQVIAITDNDSAGVTFTPALPGPLSIAEGGATATYDLELTSEPTGTVTTRTHCRNGHELTPDNIRHRPDRPTRAAGRA